MRYISWNCRGLGSKAKEEAIKDLIRIQKPDILLIQETKMEENTLLQAGKSFWKKGPGIANNSRGASGGIATFWDSNLYELEAEERTQHWIYTKLVHKTYERTVSLFNLYAPVLISEKKECWSSLETALNQLQPDNFIIAGDLNITLAAREKKGGSPVRDPSREWVEDLILGWDLLDIAPSKGTFTWNNKRAGPGHIAARLDRFLVSSSYLSLGLLASSKILPNSISDHKPILLDLSPDQDLGPIPFRFSPTWIQHDDFLQIVTSSWNAPIKGTPSYVWEKKLKRLKAALKAWAKNISSPISKRISAQSELEIHQLQMETIPIDNQLQKEEELQKNYFSACRIEEEYWRQKSRSLWLKSGDKNTKYFHKQAEARKNFKAVTEINHQGRQIKDYDDIKQAALDTFKAMFSAPLEADLNPCSHPFDLIPPLISSQENSSLTAPVTMMELKKALESMNPDSAPGPDGFTARFFSYCWAIIKYDLLKMIRFSQETNKLGGSTNSSFLALIPKEKGAASFNRFRPISLCNTGYKLVTKIIASRIKNILPKIIPENQGGFIKGRKILDNIILVQEAIHSSCSKKEKGMVIKLDLANAFDRVRYDFLFTVMTKFGFSTTFINWIKGCICGPWIAPLVNGRPTNFFQASRGLRQGCPLSPLLYAIQASVLSFQLNFCHDLYSLRGLEMAKNVREINHAQFADDTLLLGGANIHTAAHFKSELDLYKEISGSKINFHKSKIYSWNSNIRELREIANILGMESTADWDSFTYLGIPICKKNIKSAKWEAIIEKIKNKIQSWNANWLNLAGRTVLLKSVLNSMPIYQSSMLLAPKAVIRKIEILLKKFIWEGGKGNEKKIHLVSWEKIQKPREEGGLHMKRLVTQNLALGAKLLWQIVSGKDSWSKKVLRKKYFRGPRKRCLDHTPTRRKGSPIYDLCIKAMEPFQKNLHWIPGNGKSIKVWEDSILGDTPLGQCNELNNIKRWLQSKGVNTLWDLSEWERNNWTGWKIQDLPPNLEEEGDVLRTFLQGKSPIKNNIKDKRGWGRKTGRYTTGEGYKLMEVIPYAAPNPGVWKFLWTTPFVPKIDFFCWTTAHKSNLTVENLKKRGIEGPSRCPLCKNDEETLDHILIRCPFSKEVWDQALMMTQRLNLPENSQELFLNWMASSPFQLSKKSLLQAAWNWIPKAICWNIWIERNNRIFREKERHSSKIAIQARAIIGEALVHNASLSNSKQLSNEEDTWLTNLIPNHQQKTPANQNTKNSWEIRLDKADFDVWRNALNRKCLFFDGASKGNPGKAGSGGVILCENGSIISSFHWGLGTSTNNIAESSGLLQGLRIALTLGITKLTVFGDSKLLIQAIHSKTPPANLNLTRPFLKIQALRKKFQAITFYHILRDLNQLADAEANKGSNLDRGILNLNGTISRHDLP